VLLGIISESGEALDPETLKRLQEVFEKCRLRLEGVYGGGDGSQLNDRLRLAAKRLTDLAQEGVVDPDLLEKQALAGLLPEYPR
jgi:hypothetical protein